MGSRPNTDNADMTYYYLQPGDIIQEGDEVQLPKVGWKVSAFHGATVLETSHPYRREMKTAKI